ncbi:MAG: DUF2786 domain-containing protein [Deltaproteobacteria bacterium]|jgi:hypothetical protein|nr:DUF2786 domain-containing protein [Deltaproteobacteria bacterium]
MPPKDNKQALRLEIDAKLKNSWIKLLNGHYEELIQTWVPYYKSLKLNNLKPFIYFFENKTQWGFFKPEENLIGLNLKLLTDCPWNTVLGILDHEIAHQLAYHCDPLSRREPPHGPAFLRFCELLHVDPVFARASTDEMTAKNPPTPYDSKKEITEPNPILVKVQKLLALSASPSAAEAEAALTAASRLMARHNLELPKNDPAGLYESFERRIMQLGRRLTYRDSLLANILSDHFFVKTVVVYQYDHIQNLQYRALELIGRPVNLILAEHVFHFLKERCETLWNHYKPLARTAGEFGQGAKNIFMTSLLTNFRRKLELAEHNSKVQEGLASSALILKKDACLEDFCRKCFPLLKTSYCRGSNVKAPFSRQAGAKAGWELTINEPISQEKSFYLSGNLEQRRP